MVGGLVQHQQIGPLPDDQRQCQAGFFTAGEGGDGLCGAVPAKVEATEEVENLLFSCLGAEALYMQRGAGGQVQRFQLLLVEIAGAAVFAGLACAIEQWQAANQALQQG